LRDGISGLRLFEDANQIGQSNRVYIADCNHLKITGAEAVDMESRAVCRLPIGCFGIRSRLHKDRNSMFPNAVEK
jgi:hypothetical protein